MGGYVRSMAPPNELASQSVEGLFVLGLKSATRRILRTDTDTQKYRTCCAKTREAATYQLKDNPSI